MVEFKEKTKQLLERKFNPNTPPPKIEPVLEIYSGGKWRPVARRNSLGAVVGRMKTRKSLILSYMTASILKRGAVSIFRCLVDLPKDSYIVYIDTEQSETDFWIAQKRILTLIGKDSPPDNYIAVPTLGESKSDLRGFIMDVVDTLIRDGKHIGCLIVDGLVDICDDYMSNTPSEQAVNLLHAYTKHIDLVITVLHLNKDGRETRGALGTAIDNKCSFQIKVEKKMDEDTFSTLYSKLTRGFRPFPQVTIYQESDGYIRHMDTTEYGYDDNEDDISFGSNTDTEKDNDLPF